MRLRFDWAALEPQPGVYDWATADAWIGDAVRAGLVPLVVLDGSPSWARAEQDRTPVDNPLAPPADPHDMARFAAAFAARYADQVRYYQVWDEPNIAPHWGSRWIEPVAYAQLLKTVAPAIRAADPDAIIAAAALAPTADRGHTAIDEVYFLQRMVAAGAAGSFDAVAIEPFGFGYAPSHARQALPVLDFQRAALIRREMAAMGLSDKPLWAVRFGWNRMLNGMWGTVTPENQAGYAAAAMDLAWRRWPWLEALGWAIDAPSCSASGSTLGLCAVRTQWRSGSSIPGTARLADLTAAYPSWRGPACHAGRNVAYRDAAGPRPGRCDLAQRGSRPPAAVDVVAWGLAPTAMASPDGRLGGIAAALLLCRMAAADWLVLADLGAAVPGAAAGRPGSRSYAAAVLLPA